MQKLVNTCKLSLKKSIRENVYPRFSRTNTAELVSQTPLSEAFNSIKKFNLNDLDGHQVNIHRGLSVPSSIEDLFSYTNLKYGSSIATCVFPYLDEDFNISIFFLPKGFVIPYHDHDGMVVMTKILAGKVDIASMSIDDSLGYDLARFEGVKRLQHSENALEAVSILGPVEGNVHEVRALEDTIMFDILTPPYDLEEDRDCIYYRTLETNEENVYRLKPYYPENFTCQLVNYKGTPLV